MKEKVDIKEIGQMTINLLRVKHSELKSILNSFKDYDDRKKADRLGNAILRSIDTIRRSLLDDETLF